jgi:hypothetical protein
MNRSMSSKEYRTAFGPNRRNAGGRRMCLRFRSVFTLIPRSSATSSSRSNLRAGAGVVVVFSMGSHLAYDRFGTAGIPVAWWARCLLLALCPQSLYAKQHGKSKVDFGALPRCAGPQTAAADRLREMARNARAVGTSRGFYFGRFFANRTGKHGEYMGKQRVTTGRSQTARGMAHLSPNVDFTGDFVGSSGRTRTYNPSVNSRMLYH